MITLEDCKKFAKENGFELSTFAEKIIARTNANDGYCPCCSEQERNEHPENNYMCPCSLCKNDVETKGYCHCHLFQKSTKIWDNFEKHNIF